MVKGKKITKRKLKEPDEFISLTQRAFFFITHHLKLIATGGIIVLILLLAILVYLRWEKKNEAEAYQKFSLAVEIYQMVSSPHRQGLTTNYKNALEKFDEVIAQFSRSPSGRFSILYKGNIHLQLNDFDEAIKAYQNFLQKTGGKKLFHQFAMEGLGYAYEGKKDYEKALHTYQKVLEIDTSFQPPNVYLDMGRCYEKLGKNKEATENYKTFLKTSQKSVMTNAVLRKISYLEK